MAQSDTPKEKTGSKKEKLSVTTSPYISQRMYEFVEVQGLFSSYLEMALVALTMLVTRLDMRYEYKLPGFETLEEEKKQ